MITIIIIIYNIISIGVNSISRQTTTTTGQVTVKEALHKLSTALQNTKYAIISHIKLIYANNNNSIMIIHSKHPLAKVFHNFDVMHHNNANI